MNKVILMGRLTRDPNVRYSPRNNSQEEMAIARYTLAVDRRHIRRKRTLVVCLHRPDIRKSVCI